MNRILLTILLVFLTLPLSGCGDGLGDSTPSSLSDTGFRASAISSGDFHTCAVLPGGQVQCWGLNGSGQLGNDSALNSFRPVFVSGIGSATQVSAGAAHACALLTDSTIRCWGLNSSGQLGNDSRTNSNVPVRVSGISTATAIAAGSRHTCALLADNTVRCWGENLSGQLGNNSADDALTPVPVTGISAAVQITAGTNHTCARLTDASLRCWGDNSLSQLGNTSVVRSLTPVSVSGVSSATSLASGANHNCAVISNGTVLCWGNNSRGQLGNPWTISPSSLLPITTSALPLQMTGITTAVGVTAGQLHTCVVLTDSTVRCAGDNGNGQLGNGSQIGLTPPGAASGFSTYVPVAVTNVNTAVSADAGQAHTCARLSNGRVVCWGQNAFGQLGDGTQLDSIVPVSVIP